MYGFLQCFDNGMAPEKDIWPAIPKVFKEKSPAGNLNIPAFQQKIC